MTAARAHPEEPQGRGPQGPQARRRGAAGVLALVPEPVPDRVVADLAQILVDVLAGQRGLDQLMPHVTTEVLAQVRRAINARHGDPRPLARPAARTAPPRERRMVASTHIQRPAPGVVEAAVVVRGASRSAAMALRLEWRESRWRCTTLDARA